MSGVDKKIGQFIGGRLKDIEGVISQYTEGMITGPEMLRAVEVAASRNPKLIAEICKYQSTRADQASVLAAQLDEELQG